MAKRDPSTEIEGKVQAVTRMPPPDPEFVETLWGKMEPKASRKMAGVSLQRVSGFFREAWQLGASLAGLAVLIGLLVFGIKLLPRDSRLPAGVPGEITQTAAASTPNEVKTVVPGVSPTSTSLPAPIPSRLVNGACSIPISQALNGQYLGRANQDNIEQLVGGGSAQNEAFTFEIWLACGNEFGRQAYVSDHYSEIEGLGLLVGWTYQGADLEGETLDYAGFEPFIREHGSSTGTLNMGSSTINITGIQFPAGIIPDFSQADTPLRYVIKTRTPDGKLTGAALTFTLQRQPEGYQPVNIQIHPLSEADLQAAESPALSKPSFATIDPESLYPELKAIRELSDRYQDPLRSSPGWIYMKTKNENPGGIGMYGGLTAWTSEAWLQIGANGYVIGEVHVDRDAGGQLLQQTYSKDGRSNNLTYGTSGAYTPYRLNLTGQLYNDLYNQLRAGKPFDRKEVTVDGRKAWAVTITDTFTPPVSIENVMTSKLARSTVIDPQSGTELYSELLRTTPEEQEQLVWRQTFEAVERVSELPEEAISILGQMPGPYQPPAPQGAPAPEGFNPSQTELSLQSIPGDSFDQPTFWYGDLYAGSYLLGRVNFGGSPGGYCARSFDGWKLAYNFLVTPNASEGHEYLRWLDLHDIDQVFDPAPELELISKVTWSPVVSQLAFTACKAGRTDCGLYRFDADTNQVKLLSTADVGYPQPVWKPDGSQIAFLTADVNNVFRLYVVDAAAGETVYQGDFNPDTWQAAQDSPTHDWGVEISRGYTGGDCFKQQP